MSDRIQEFEVGDRPALEVRLGSGEIHITEGDAGTIKVTLRGSDRTLESIDIEQQGETVSITSRKKSISLSDLDVEVAVPRDTTVSAKLASMNLSASVPLRRLSSSVAAGDIQVDAVEGDVDVRSASGDVRIERIGGGAKVAVASGDIRIGEIHGDAAIKSGSGDIEVARVTGRCDCKTASGNTIIRTFEGRSFHGKAMAGDMVVGLPPGRTLDVSLQTLAGSVRNEFDVGGNGDQPGEASLDIKTMSGDIVLRSAG